MRNLQDISSTNNSAYVYKSETEHILRKRSKQRLQTNPTKLAANLFSYYREPFRKQKNKHGSFALTKAKSNFFNDRNRSSILNTDAETKQSPSYMNELAPSYNRISSAKPGHTIMREQQKCEVRPTSEYSTELAKFSTAAHNPSNQLVNQSLPSLPENMFQHFIHKQSQMMLDNSVKPAKNKRKMDISLLSSNLSKKDCIPKFQEGIRQQMERQRNRRITANNWYVNAESKSSTYNRKSKTASGKRRNYNYADQSKIIDISDQSLREFNDSPPNQKIQQLKKVEIKEKSKLSKFPIFLDMMQMVKDAYEQYI